MSPFSSRFASFRGVGIESDDAVSGRVVLGLVYESPFLQVRRSVVSTLGVADHHELVTLSLNVVSGDVHFVRKYAGVKILSEPLRKDSVGGYVFHDVNADGVRRHDDAPVEGRTVILRDSSGNQLASTTTDADGRYGFAGFAVGNYIVDFGSGQFTTPYAANFAIDSDAQPNGRTQVISVSENYRQTWIDAGILAGAISGSLFVDLNGDGIENEGRYLADRAIDLYSEQGDLVASTVTDVNGWYQFANLQAGNYIVDFGDGPFTAMGVGAETTDSDANPTDGRSGVIQIVTGQHASNIDAGVLLGPFQELGGVVAMEAENGQLGVNWQVTSDLAASGAAYIQIDPVKNHTGASPASTAPEDVVEYDFNITTGGNYKLWFRMLAPTPNDDSFFWRLDGGGWNEVNQATGVGVWFSRDNSQTDSLAAGIHTLALAYRENGTGIDKFVLQLDSLAAPTGDGPTESSRGGVTSFALSANAVTLLAASTTAPPRPYYQRSVPVQAANEEGAAANEEAFALIALNISLSEPNDGSQVLEPEEWTADQSDSTEWLDELAIELVLRHALIFG